MEETRQSIFRSIGFEALMFEMGGKKDEFENLYFSMKNEATSLLQAESINNIYLIVENFESDPVCVYEILACDNSIFHLAAAEYLEQLLDFRYPEAQYKIKSVRAPSVQAAEGMFFPQVDFTTVMLPSPALLIVIGFPGSGKSTVSKILAEKYKAEILDADEFWKGLLDIDEKKKDQVFPEEQQGLAYKGMFLAAKYLLKNNINVVIDAALWSNDLVDKARALAKDAKVIQVICPENLLKRRITKRVKKSGDKYSAGLKVYEYLKNKTEVIKDIDYVIDSSKDLESQLKEIDL